MFGNFSQSNNIKPTYNTNDDYEVPDPPKEGVSKIAFSPISNYMACTSWDQTVRIWEINHSNLFWDTESSNLKAQGKALKTHSAPLLSTLFSPDGNNLFYGSIDGKGYLWNLQTDKVHSILSHDDAVIEALFIPNSNILVTGSWDKTIKFWDCRQLNSAFTYNAIERVTAMDARGHMIVIALSNKKILVFDARNTQNPVREDDSPLKFLTRCVACFLDQKGYYIGSIEGRLAVQDCENDKKSFTFKCHRSGNQVYGINTINVHPVYGSIMTGGTDGAYHTWDKNLKRRLKNSKPSNESITAASFNKDGQYYAYALCYDWRIGCTANSKDMSMSHVMIHAVNDVDVNPGFPNQR